MMIAGQMRPPFSPRGENGPRPVQKTRREGDFGLGPPLRRYDSWPVSGPSIVPLPRKSARFIRRRRRFADFPPPGPPLQTTQRGGCGPLFGNSPSGAAAGREAERFDKHPGMRCHGTACGISVGGEARYSAPGWNWASLRKAGYQPSHPQTCPHGQVWTKRLFLPPCTAHSFSPRRKRMGGALPSHHHGCHFRVQVWTLFTLHCAPAATAAPNTASAGGHWPPWPEQRHHPPPGSKAPWPGSGPYTAPPAP